jgi:hypothetical protein
MTKRPGNLRRHPTRRNILEQPATTHTAPAHPHPFSSFPRKRESSRLYPPPEEEAIACENECDQAEAEAHDAAQDRWDEWLARACGTVDSLVAAAPPGFSPTTVSTVSTPALAQALAARAGSASPSGEAGGGRGGR